MTYSGEPPFRQPGGEAAADNVVRLADAVLDVLGLRIPEAPAADSSDATASAAATRPYLRLVETVA